MSLRDFLVELVERLDQHGIPYMVSGSVASSIHGEPRTTRDVDLVLEVDGVGLRTLLASFDPNTHYVDAPNDAEPVSPGQMFNVIDPAGGWKADLVVRKDRPFSIAEFARRRDEQLLGLRVFVASPEDVILSKLEWARRSGSHRQIDDARGIVAVQGEQLDVAYLRRWAVDLGIVDLLSDLLD